MGNIIEGSGCSGCTGSIDSGQYQLLKNVINAEYCSSKDLNNRYKIFTNPNCIRWSKRNSGQFQILFIRVSVLEKT